MLDIPGEPPRFSLSLNGLSQSFFRRLACCLPCLFRHHHSRGLLPTSWPCPAFCTAFVSCLRLQQSCSSGRGRRGLWHDSCCPNRRAQGYSQKRIEGRCLRAHRLPNDQQAKHRPSGYQSLPGPPLRDNAGECTVYYFSPHESRFVELSSTARPKVTWVPCLRWLVSNGMNIPKPEA